MQPPVLEEKSFEEMKEIFEHLSLSYQWRKTWVPIVLFCDCTQTRHQQFVQNFAKALSTHFAYCQVVDAKNSQASHHSDWVFAPASLLNIEKTLPLHQVIKRKTGQNIFILAEFDRYLQDQDLKRSLWNALKTVNIQVMRRSS